MPTTATRQLDCSSIQRCWRCDAAILTITLAIVAERPHRICRGQLLSAVIPVALCGVRRRRTGIPHGCTRQWGAIALFTVANLPDLRQASNMPEVNRKRKREGSDGASAPGASSSLSSSLRSAPPPSPFLRVLPSSIGNKMKRAQVYGRQKHEKATLHAKERRKRRKAAAALGEDEKAAKRVADAARQRTLDKTREADDTVVQEADAEVQADEAMDEFSAYFKGEQEPKLIITTSYRPSKRTFDFIRDLLHVFPNSFYYARKQFEVRAHPSSHQCTAPSHAQCQRLRH